MKLLLPRNFNPFKTMPTNINMSAKLITFWILGGIFLFMGTWIIMNVQPDIIGVSEASVYFAYLLSIVLYILAGLAWISVAVATKHEI